MCSCAVESTKAEFQLLPTDREERELELVEVYVSQVKECHTQEGLQFLKQLQPHPVSLDHLKCFHRSILPHDKSLRILLCPVSQFEDADALREIISKAGLSDVLDPVAVKVSRHAPITRAQFDEWRILWPCIFRNETRKEVLLTDSETAMCRRFAGLLRERFRQTDSDRALPQERSSPNDPVCTYNSLAMIVDPKSEKIIAEAIDERLTKQHPLRHAALIAIEKVGHANLEAKAVLNASQDSSLSDEEGASLKRKASSEADKGRCRIIGLWR